NNWHYVVGVFNGSFVRVYVDGVSSTPVSAASLNWPVQNLLIGDRSALGRAFSGKLDEVKLSNIARDDAYIKTSYNNQKSPSTFIGVGVEESEVCVDLDSDGYNSNGGLSCGAFDCDDNNTSIHPGIADVCGNGIDDDCDGLIDEGCVCAIDSDCDVLENVFCDSNNRVLNNYVCLNATCVFSTPSFISNCSDGLFCNGAESCSEGACVAGTPVICSSHNIPGIATCTDVDSDSNPWTWDFRDQFTSVCMEPGTCSDGSLTITHTCDDVGCSAQCDDTHPCAPTVCSGYNVTNACLADCACEYNSC
ncbi:MAG: LamG-like jellyroll fold domain-containing protein, partial [archaeon]